MNGVQKILSSQCTKTIKEYKEIQKLIDPLVKRYFETYYEEWQHFSDWDFDDNGENVIINYSYLDYNDEWEYDSIDVSFDKIIEMKGVQTTIINSLMEGRKVLALLGVEDVVDYDNVDDVLTLICEKEYELKQQFGDKLLRGNIKQVFNTYATTKERKKALQELIDEIQKED